MSLALTKPVRKTYHDFARLPEGTLAQLIDGEIIMSPAPKPKHQKISMILSFQLMEFVKKNKLGEILCSPIDVYFDAEETYQPDIIFIGKDRSGLIGETKIEGAPDLIVEILSDSTAYYDLKHKKIVYEAFGVKEYWIVDPKEQTIEILTLINEKYQLVMELKKTGMAKSILLDGLQINIEQVFAEI